MKRTWLFGMLFLGLSACGFSAAAQDTSPETRPAAPLPDLGPAPELTNQTWLNTPGPLRLADLRGKVVAIDMWTFG
jgi:hypothetical protein